MANSKKLVTGLDGVSRLIELTDDEQTTLDAERKAWADGANARNWEEFRRLRNDKLAETDWRATADLTLSDARKTYRQELRDMTKDWSDDDVAKFITNVEEREWPTEPS